MLGYQLPTVLSMWHLWSECLMTGMTYDLIVMFDFCFIIPISPPHLSAIVQSRRLSLFGHIARMPDETDAKQILTASPAGNWRKPPGRPRIT